MIMMWNQVQMNVIIMIKDQGEWKEPDDGVEDNHDSHYNPCEARDI